MKLNQRGKNNLKQKIRGFTNVIQLDMVVILPVALVLQAFLLAVGMQVITFADYNILYNWFDVDNLLYPMYNVLLLYIALQLLFCVFKKVIPGYIIVTVFSVIISVINNMKWVNLKECVTISDFEKISEAVRVAGEAEFNLFKDMWACVLGGIALLVILIFLDIKVFRGLKRQPVKMKTCRITLFILIVILIPIITIDAKGSAVAKLTESRSADKTGPIVYFVESIFTSYLDEPYSLEEAETSYDEYVEKGKQIVERQRDVSSKQIEFSTGVTSSTNKDLSADYSIENPNIIVIMSEAFYDVNMFEDTLLYSEDPMTYYKDIEAHSVASGNTMVNIYGGSTHFSEFEFLTGWNSKGMNSGSCPYKEYFNEEQPSFARYLQRQGYYTLAIHPYDSYFWNRKNAYPNMGFDKFIDRSWMKYTDKCGYISDDALTNEIIYRYEERQNNEEEPFFCFGVSIANHVAMINREEFENTANHIEVAYNQGLNYSDRKLQRLKDYIGGISKSGEALKKLTDYFKKQDEPTVIVFFGDHAPNYAIDILRLSGKEELSYQTPYLIWANYELELQKEKGDINVSYLSTYLMQILNMPLTDQNYYNIALQNVYPYETRYEVRNTVDKNYDAFSRREQNDYFEHALDMKKHIPTLLDNEEVIYDIWNIK